MFENLTIDDLLIRGSSHTPFFGIYLATHAISDGMCMCHASVGCKVKTQEHLVGHDGVEDAHNRRRYSQLIDEDLIQGSTAQLEDEVAAFQRRLRSQLVVLDGSTPVSLQAQPMQPVVERLRARTGVDVVHVQARNYEDDLYGGYAATTATLFARQYELFGDEAEVAADEVGVLGLPFDRYEGDCQGNVAEVRRLLWALGLKARAVYFAGEPYAHLRATVHARAHLALPWMAPARRALQKTARDRGIPLVEAGVPMGFSGTARWLRHVGASLGVPDKRVEQVVAAELNAAKPLAELARRQLSGRSFAAFAEAPRLAGLVAHLTELEMVPAVLGVLHFRLGGRQEVERQLRQDFGVELPPGVTWLENPAPHEVAALGQGGPDGMPGPLQRVSVVLGTTVEREQLGAVATPFLEFGFPSENRHFLLPAPWLGTRGALRLAEQVLQAVAVRSRR